MHKQRSIIIAACGAGAVATFLPWASVLGMSVNGTKGDGWISMFIFIVAIALTVIGNRMTALKGGFLYGVIICGLAAIALGVFEIQDITSKLKAAGLNGSIGTGVYLITAAGAIIVLAGFLLKGKPAAAPQQL